MSQFKIDAMSTQHVENPETLRGGNRHRVPESKPESTAAPESRSEQAPSSINQAKPVGDPLPAEIDISRSGGSETTLRTPSSEATVNPTGSEELTAIHAGQLMNINKQRLIAEGQKQRELAKRQAVETERRNAVQTASDRAAKQDNIITERVAADLSRTKAERKEEAAGEDEVPQAGNAADKESRSNVLEIREQRTRISDERRDQTEASALRRRQMIAAADQSQQNVELARKGDTRAPEQRRDEKVNIIGTELFRYFNTRYAQQSSAQRESSPAADSRAITDDPPFGVVPSAPDRKPIELSSLNTPPESIPTERQPQPPETAATQQEQTRPTEEGSAAVQEEARRAVKRLQEEGVFGHSPFGLPRTVSQFIYHKEREYEFERRQFTADDFLRETEQAIYETLKGEHATTVTRTLIETAEAVNSFRNLMIRAAESSNPRASTPPETHIEPRQPGHEPER